LTGQNVTYHDFARTYHMVALRPTSLCLLTSVSAAQFPHQPTVPPLPWWAGDLSGVTSRFHRRHFRRRHLITHGGKELLPVRCSARILFNIKVSYLSCSN